MRHKFSFQADSIVIGSRTQRSRGSVLILYTLLLPILLMFTGLAIDLSMLYVVQTRLSAAVDRRCPGGRAPARDFGKHH